MQQSNILFRILEIIAITIVAIEFLAILCADTIYAGEPKFKELMYEFSVKSIVGVGLLAVVALGVCTNWSEVLGGVWNDIKSVIKK